MCEKNLCANHFLTFRDVCRSLGVGPFSSVVRGATICTSGLSHPCSSSSSASLHTSPTEVGLCRVLIPGRYLLRRSPDLSGNSNLPWLPVLCGLSTYVCLDLTSLRPQGRSFTLGSDWGSERERSTELWIVGR